MRNDMLPNVPVLLLARLALLPGIEEIVQWDSEYEKGNLQEDEWGRVRHPGARSFCV